MDNSTHHKYLIIGAGPAGLQMAYFLKKSNLDYVVLDRNQKGNCFFSKFPVHRRLISINKKYNFFQEKEFNMRHDWNSLLSEDNDMLRVTDYSNEIYPEADVYTQYLADYAEHNRLNIRYNTVVSKIRKNKEDKFVLDIRDNETLTADILIVATGALRQNMPEEIEGIEYTTPYEEVGNTEQFTNKRVAVLGGGNSGLETADALAHNTVFVHLFTKEKVKLSYETHFVGNTRAKYTNIFDLFHLKSMHAVLNPRIRKITKLPNGLLQTQHEYDYPDSKIPGTLKLTREYDYIINCTGFKYTHKDLFDERILPETVMKDKFYNINEKWESTNVKDLYFIGTLMQATDRKSASGFVHGFRYNIRTLFGLLNESYENIPYPFETHPTEPFKDFLEKLYHRFSITDGLYQLYGTLGDKLVYEEKSKMIEWSKELPVRHIRKNIDPQKHTFILTLEFGNHNYPGMSSLEFSKPSDPNNTKMSYFLHPVIRHYYGGIEDEFHFGDSLLGRWDMIHADGGSIASYHAEFYNWFADILGIEKTDLTNIGENPHYEKW